MPPSPFLAASVEHDEIARFSALAKEWWAPSGALRMLHALTPLRIAYIKDRLTECGKRFKNLRVLDIGCGGGLLAEALAQQGAIVTGIDVSAEVLDVARAHAAKEKLCVTYTYSSAEAMAQTQERFDLVLACEILEHVADKGSFFRAAATLVSPQGLMIVATLNRTRLSFLLGIVAAEHILGWIPPGTHDWDKFTSPSELAALCEQNGLCPVDITGLRYSPRKRAFCLEKRATKVNYFMAARKQP